MGCRQMGQREDVWGVGGGTVRIGRCVVDEMGGEGLGGEEAVVGLVKGDGAEGWETGVKVEEASETVLGTEGVCATGEVLWVLLGGRGPDLEGVGSPDIMGGGRSSPSAAFRESCVAKSEACHHSRNLRAKMEVGRRILRLDRMRGKIVVARVRGLYKLLFWPGHAPGPEDEGTGGCIARAMAR